MSVKHPGEATVWPNDTGLSSQCGISVDDSDDTINTVTFGGGVKLIGGTGNDTPLGESGNDFLKAGDGNDAMSGGDGDNSMDGEIGDDTLLGGNDTLRGSSGRDRFLGEEGNDRIETASQDTISGGCSNTIVGRPARIDEAFDFDVLYRLKPQLHVLGRLRRAVDARINDLIARRVERGFVGSDHRRERGNQLLARDPELFVFNEHQPAQHIER